MLGPKAALLARYMDLKTIEQQLGATNIANADTPGYRARGIDFQWEFQHAMAAAGNDRLPAVTLKEVQGLAVKNDGNNVDLDREMRLLADTTIRYSHAAQMLKGTIRSLRSAIQEGRGG